MYFRIVFDYAKKSGGDYANPEFNSVAFPPTFYNDEKRFCKVYVEEALINGEVAGQDDSHMLLKLQNIRPLNQIEPIASGGLTSSGLLCLPGFFKSGPSNDVTFRFQSQEDRNYLLFDKNDFNTTTFQFKLQDAHEADLEEPSANGYDDYHIMLGVETTDEL